MTISKAPPRAAGTLLSPIAAVLVLTLGTPVVTKTNNIILTPAPATLALTRNTPTLRTTVRPTAKALAIAPATPTLKSTVRLSPASLALAITPAAPTLKTTIRPATRALTIAPATPTLQSIVRLNPASKALTITRNAPTVGRGVRPTTRALVITRATPKVGVSQGYAYYRRLTVDHTKCGSGVSSNFRVLVSITGVAGLRDIASGGYINNWGTQAAPYTALDVPCDLVFSSDPAGVNKYPWEIEWWDSEFGDLIAWVLLPSVSDTVDPVFYMAYSDPGVFTQQNIGAFSPNSVWTDYRFVAHCYTPVDSTASPAIKGTGHGGDFGAEGVIFTGAAFGGVSNQWSDWGSPVKTQLANNFSVSMWALCIGTGTQPLFRNQARSTVFKGFAVYFDQSGANSVTLLVADGTVNDFASLTWSGLAFHDSVWRYLAFTFSNGVGEMFVNGVSQGTRTSATVTSIGYGSELLAVGSNAPLNAFFIGNLDEIRIAASVLSANRLLAEYNNQIVPGDIGAPGFITIGAETPAGAVTVTLTPAAASLIFTAATPVVRTTTVLTPAVRALTITPATPTVTSTVRLSPATKALTITPATPTLKTSIRVSPAAKALAIVPATPTLKSIVRLTPAPKALALSSGTPTLRTTIRPAAAALALTAATPTLRPTIKPATKALTITPGTPAVFISAGNVMHPAPKALVIIPGTPTLRTITVLHPAAAALALTPKSPTLRTTLRPAVRALVLSLGTPVLRIGRVLQPAPQPLLLSVYTPTIRIAALLRQQPMATIV